MTVPWSFSSLTSFENCPRKHYHVREIKDVPDPPGEAATWGTEVHAALERRLKGQPLPDFLRTFEPYVAKIEAIPGTLETELQVAINAQMQPTEWFSADVWCRGIFDVAIDGGESVVLLDWKTGRRKPDSDQLELFAALASILYPAAQTFRTMFLWLKEKKTDKAVYRREEIPAIWTKFMRRVNRLDAARESKTFPPKPSGLCGWCPVRSCEFWKPRRGA